MATAAAQPATTAVDEPINRVLRRTPASTAAYRAF
jgi:hypothetical protein